jgi:3,4-dihydroxy 2-butanone 4-phosphate synthase / GTP cyclohydrolase II
VSGDENGVERALAALTTGRALVVIDDVNAWGGGDLVFAAELATPELMAFMVRHTSGFVCVSLPDHEADRLDLPPMWSRHRDRPGQAYAVTVDAATNGTGISAVDRTRTVRLLAGKATEFDALTRPGHIVPVRVAPGGVQTNPGRAEAAHDLAQLAGLRPVCVLASVVSTRSPTEMADSFELREFAADHDLVCVSIKSLVAHLESLPNGRVRRSSQGERPPAG